MWSKPQRDSSPCSESESRRSPQPELARDLLRDHDDDKEHFWAILLNAQNHYLLHTLVSIGTQSASLVHPREVLGPALREGAASVILVHNHPSGVMRTSGLCGAVSVPRASGARVSRVFAGNPTC